MLQKDHLRAILETMDEEHTETYANLIKAFLSKLCPDSDENHIGACEQLSQRRFHKEKTWKNLPMTLNDCCTNTHHIY